VWWKVTYAKRTYDKDQREKSNTAKKNKYYEHISKVSSWNKHGINAVLNAEHVPDYVKSVMNASNLPKQKTARKKK
jgi:hypothetical protein